MRAAEQAPPELGVDDLLAPLGSPGATDGRDDGDDAGEDARALARLREGLARRASAAGDLDVAYRDLDSPIGPLRLAASPAGIVRVAFAGEDGDAVLADLARRVGARVLRAAAPLDPAARELEEYFAGTRRRFDVPVDLRLAGGFRRTVLDRLRDVGYGATATYAELASAAGSPRAVRAVGSACALNPVPLFVPCHRVVRSDGTAGRYRGGEAAKAALLALEAR